jgi:hypothetical protein
MQTSSLCGVIDQKEAFQSWVTPQASLGLGCTPGNVARLFNNSTAWQHCLQRCDAAMWGVPNCMKECCYVVDNSSKG